MQRNKRSRDFDLLRPERIPLYSELQHRIGGTDLREFTRLPVPGIGNRIFTKCEWQNPTASHYDRIFFEIIRDLEAHRQLEDDVLFDASTGNGALSMAWLCNELGFDCRVLVPGNILRVTEAEIRRLKASPQLVNPYAEGISKGLQETFEAIQDQAEKDHRRAHWLQHSLCKQALVAAQDIGSEIVKALDEGDGLNAPINADYFIGTLGNGLSMYGPGLVLREKWPSIQIIGLEPVDSPTFLSAWCRKRGLDFEDVFRSKAGKEFPGWHTHDFRGTGARTSQDFDPVRTFVFLSRMITSNFVNDVELVTKAEVEALGAQLLEAGEPPEELPGPTSIASLLAAFRLARSVQNKTLVVFQYDLASKYVFNQWEYAQKLTPFTVG